MDRSKEEGKKVMSDVRGGGGGGGGLRNFDFNVENVNRKAADVLSGDASRREERTRRCRGVQIIDSGRSEPNLFSILLFLLNSGICFEFTGWLNKAFFRCSFYRFLSGSF